ncbi:MAG: hypothetical protein OXI67_00130 [Candidatus Poribacteria bacterium]|nr:hypothetical protein [Candidatus Poribacteria bacterium]
MRLKSIGIAIAMLCSLCLAPCVFAQLAIDGHAAKKIVDDEGHPLVSVSVSIDSLSYNSGNGAVDLGGSFFIYNYDPKRDISYDGEIRLEIFDLNGNAYLPHAEEEVDGSLEENDADANWWEISDSFSESISLHMDCLSPTAHAEPIEAGEEYSASANIALRVTGFRNSETWSTSYSYTFRHNPETAVEQLEGIGPTTDGETFSDDCTVNSNDDDERESWQSLIYTDTPYYAVYWYVKAPGDTSTYGSNADVTWGDGATRNATMTTSFPEDVDDPNKQGNQDAVWYEITAYVYRWDLSVYTKSYRVWVQDAD